MRGVVERCVELKVMMNPKCSAFIRLYTYHLSKDLQQTFLEWVPRPGSGSLVTILDHQLQGRAPGHEMIRAAGP
jgi:hypothetical protein